MQLAYPQNDTRAETLRYLGAGGWQPDAASQVLLQKAEDALRAAATPRGVWKQLPLTALPLQNAGNDIARHLRGVSRFSGVTAMPRPRTVSSAMANGCCKVSGQSP